MAKTKILDLTLDDLDLDLDLKPKRMKGGLKPKAKGKRQAFLPPPVPLRQPKSPWQAEARVLVQFYGKCSHCLSQWTYPQSQLLVRFRHKRDPNRIWEKAEHPSEANLDLPRILRRIQVPIRACPHCWSPQESIETACEESQHLSLAPTKSLVPTEDSNLDLMSKPAAMPWDILQKEIKK